MTSQQAKVTVYTTRVCAYCFMAKSILAKRGIAFDEVDVSNDTEKRTWLVKATGQKTVPQIFINDVSVGGHAELAQLDRAGELVKRAFGT